MNPLICALAVLASWPFASAIAADAESQKPATLPKSSGQREVKTTYNKHWDIEIPSLQNATVSVWQDTQQKYVVEPYILPDWNGFDAAIKSACKDDGTEVTLLLDVQLDSRSVVNEVANYMKAQYAEAAALKTSELGVYPYLTLKFYTGGKFSSDDVKTKFRHRLPHGLDDISPSEEIPLNYQFFQTQPVPLTDTCVQLRKIRVQNDIQGIMLAPFNTVKVNTMRIALREFNNQDVIQDIFVDQTMKGTKRLAWQSKGGASGINLGVLSFGKTKASGTTTTIDDRKRYVSSNLMNDVVREASRSIHGSYTSEFSDAKITPDKLFTTLWSLVQSRATEATLEFKEMTGKQWELSVGQEKWLLDAPASAELIQAKIDLDQQHKQTTSGEYAGAKGSEDRQSSHKIAQDIQWKTDGPTPIPVSARVLIVDDSTFTYNDVLSWEEAQVTAGEGLQRINLKTIDKIESTVYSTGFKDGFRKAAHIYLGPPKKVIFIPFNLWPFTWTNRAAPPPPFPYMPILYCNDVLSAAKKAFDEGAKQPVPPPPQIAFDTPSYLQEHASFAARIGCTQMTWNGWGQPPIGTDLSKVFVFDGTCYINRAWGSWYRAVSIRTGGIVPGPNANACFRTMDNLPQIAEPSQEMIGPVTEAELVRVWNGDPQGYFAPPQGSPFSTPQPAAPK